MWHFTSDWHLNHHNILKYCNRPFLNKEEQELLDLSKIGSLPIKSIEISQESVQRMNQCIIDSTNSVVSEDDSLVILGDFCWTSTPKEQVARFIDSLRCKNIYLIWGNHDNRQILQPFFKAKYDQYVFYVEKQHIFVSHYPCRSWYLSNYGSWMLYGHVHNNFWHQDNQLLTNLQKESLKISLKECFNLEPEKFDFENFANSTISLFNKNLRTLDVGVDNVRENVPFGTPWSLNDIRFYMENKEVNK